MCRASQQVFASTSMAPAQARYFVIEHLARNLSGTQVLDDAVLTVAELVTNSVNAGSGRITVDVDLHRDHVLLAVTDDAPGQPAVQPFSQSATYGRGLRIVEALARRWGTDPRLAAKRVWAELAAEPSGIWFCGLP